MKKYFEEINARLGEMYKIASEARKAGFDPVEDVEIPLAKNMAERVVGIISIMAPQVKDSGIIERIDELEKVYGAQDWRVALKIAEEVAKENFCKFSSKKEAMEIGIRIGIAYITVGVVASPIEGFVELKFRKRKDGKDYVALFYSGPIRSAGGTAGAVSVLIADYIRCIMGLSEYDCNEIEVKRTVTELYDYHEKVTNLQYLPSEEELNFLVPKLPVQIDGDPSEDYEVSNYKNIERVDTNRIRNGVCLVIGECLCSKAPKLWKQLSSWGNDFGMGHWNFLEDFVKLQKRLRAAGSVKDESIKLTPDYNFIRDIVAGRPILTYPMTVGGFRLRYGRTRTSGFSSDAISPATMAILDNYIGIGTQLKTERPGKSTIISACDRIEGPIVKLKNGDVVFVEDKDCAMKIKDDVEEILFLGDILINYGDFFNRAHKLVPCGYNEEWYSEELKKIINDDVLVKEMVNNPYKKICADDMIKIAIQYDVPMHPRYTYHWNDINYEQFMSLVEWYKTAKVMEGKIVILLNDKISVDIDLDPKRVLELLGVPHKVVAKENVVIEGEDAKAFAFYFRHLDIFEFDEEKNVLKIINKMAGVKVRDKSGTFIGARMGRPEKAKMRKLTGSPQVLFPVGREGGKMRNMQECLKVGKVTADFPLMFCDKCNKESVYSICENCSGKTRKRYYCMHCKATHDEKCNMHESFGHKLQEIDIKHYFKRALEMIDATEYNEMVKGVRGTSNADSLPEHLLKGILRSKNNLYVNKDGTIRYDMTEMAITHFKPKEIGTSIEKLKGLGYEKDIHGKVLENDEQILEIKCQDIILPSCDESLEEGCDEVLFRVSRFIDQLLVGMYKQKPFYNLKTKHELIGHYVVAMSPHTSAGIVGRIIGFSKTQGFFAHPLMHSIMRRDADGDEACVILLMDALLNFSRKFLPNRRGVTQDAPLVLTSTLIPKEVDNMVFDMDIVWNYPLELYEAAMEYKNPWDVKIEKFGDNLGTEKEYKGLGFTIDTNNINEGVRCSAYKSIPTMMEKVEGQMKLAEKIRAVNENDVARLLIDRHFIRDIRGNLRKFSQQQFRCIDCNEKYRRPPLAGRCLKCSGKLVFTIAEGSIVKYLEPSFDLAEKYTLPPYLNQVLQITKKRIESIFGRDAEKQEGLKKWFSS